MSRRLLALCLAVVVVLGSGAASLAQQLEMSTPEEAEGVPLSLGDCLRLALENNLDLLAARRDPEIAGENVGVSSAEFDPVLSASANRFEATQEPTDISQAPGFRRNDFSLGVAQKLGFGADYSVTLSSTESNVDVPPGSLFFSTPTTFDSDLSIELKVPLLKGFGKTTTQEQLLLARGNLTISREELQRQAETTLQTVENAYWDVVAADRALGVARRQLRRAEDLLELNKKKVEVGTLAPIEITQAEAEVASNQEGVIAAETTLENAIDELRRVMGIPHGHPWWVDRLVPTDRPEFGPVQVDLDAALEIAMNNRAELAAARQELINGELSERAARNRIRHQLDFEATYTPSGTDIDEFLPNFDPGPDGIPGNDDDILLGFTKIGDGTMPDALQEIPDLVNRSWNARLTYSLPLRNRAAKADFAKARLAREKSEIALVGQEQNIRVEVRRAVREVESGFKRVEAARANVRLQQKKLEAEQKKFENGLSTSFEVLTFQNDLADAELSLIRAGLDYVKALTALEKAKGTLLGARNLGIARSEESLHGF